MRGGGRGRGRRGHLAALVAAALVLGGAQPAAGSAWTVVTGPGPDGRGTRCVVESERQSLPDGYQTTTAHLTVDRRTVAVTSASHLDPSFSDIGLSVDQGALVPMDRLADPRTAVFETRYEQLVESFKAGSRVRVQLRFWPEWPATGTHSATFSLIGFTRAYGALAACP